jgi:hypothetical protein
MYSVPVPLETFTDAGFVNEYVVPPNRTLHGVAVEQAAPIVKLVELFRTASKSASWLAVSAPPPVPPVPPSSVQMLVAVQP